MVLRHDADGDADQQRRESDEIVGEPAPDEHPDGCRDEAERQSLVECHGFLNEGRRRAPGTGAAYTMTEPSRPPFNVRN